MRHPRHPAFILFLLLQLKGQLPSNSLQIHLLLDFSSTLSTWQGKIIYIVGYFVGEWSNILVGADLWPLGAEICWALISFTGRASILFFRTQLSNDVDEWCYSCDS